MTTESATVSEVLALKALVSVLLAEKIREYKDEDGAAYELAKICSGIVNESRPAGPDAQGINQEALRHLDNIFGDLKSTRR
jgi:hypothetical protein